MVKGRLSLDPEKFKVSLPRLPITEAAIIIIQCRGVGIYCGIAKNKCFGETLFVNSVREFDKQINFLYRCEE